jgi:cytochrome c
MKTRILAAIGALAALGLAGGAPAQAPATDVLKAQTCLNCHDLDKKKVGPAFKDVAKKGGDPEQLVAKIRDGKGHPKINKPEADIKAAVTQALAVK